VAVELESISRIGKPSGTAVTTLFDRREAIALAQKPILSDEKTPQRSSNSPSPISPSKIGSLPLLWMFLKADEQTAHGKK
jgi:hypothetical protein